MNHFDHRCVVLALRKLDVAAIRDSDRVRQSLTLLGLRKELRHLGRALHVQLFGVPKPIDFVLVLLHADAAERVMVVVVFGPEEMGVVVGHHREVEFRGQPLEQRIDPLLFRNVPLARGEVRRVPLRLVDRQSPMRLVVGPGVVGQMMGDR